MSNLRIAVRLSILAVGIMLLAGFAEHQFGTVSAVNGAEKTFTCHWKSLDSTYRATDKTAYYWGVEDPKRTAAWKDLKVGSEITVTYHVHGKERVADKVEINGFTELKPSAN